MAHATDTSATDHSATTPTDVVGDGSKSADVDAGVATEHPPVEKLLYHGESVLDTLDVGSAQLVATSHRLVALNPAGEARVRTCERLNIDDVRPDTVADNRFAAPTVKALVAGAVLTVAGLLISFDGLLVPIDTASAPGFEGFVALLSLVMRSLALLDDLLLVSGLLSLVVGLGGLVWYLNSRTPVVRVHVVGNDDIVVCGSVDDQRDLFAFRDLLRCEEDDHPPELGPNGSPLE